MHCYVAYGLRVRSAIPIPGGLSIPACEVPDVTIELAAPEEQRPGPLYRMEGDALGFGCQGVAAYHCRTDAIQVIPEPHAEPEAIQAMLVATAFPALLWLRDTFVLHAATAVLPGQRSAIAIAGPSGIGKSTLLAQLVDAGASVVGDDTVAIDPALGAGRVSGLPGGYFAPGEHAGERPFIPVPRACSRESAPLGAIVSLARGDGREAALERLSGARAIAGLIANRHRPRIPAFLRRHRVHFELAALLVRTIPIYSWARCTGVERISPAEWAALEQIAGRREKDG